MFRYGRPCAPNSILPGEMRRYVPLWPFLLLISSIAGATWLLTSFRYVERRIMIRSSLESKTYILTANHP